jgi:uncharacterized protein (DUF983 family)
LNSLKCPRCDNHFFFREMGASLISPACAFCGLELRAAKSNAAQFRGIS